MASVNELRTNADVRDMASNVVALATQALLAQVHLTEQGGYSNRNCVVIDNLCYQICQATRFLREQWPEVE